jgi:hypothetical protein
MRFLAMSNLGLFILVGTCMLIGSAIANHRKGDFLPRNREDRVMAVGFLTVVFAVIIALVIFALWSFRPTHLEPVVYQTPSTTAPPKETPAAIAPPKEPPKIASRDPYFATLTRDVSVPLLYGVVSIRTGTKVRVVSRTESTVRIHYDGTDYDIPVAATDAETKHD